MRTLSCPNCAATYQVAFKHFYGKMCKCGYDIPSDGDIDIVKENKIKHKEVEQKALDSVVRSITPPLEGRGLNREVQE